MIFFKLILILVFIIYSALAKSDQENELYATKPDLFHMDNYDKCKILPNSKSTYCSIIYKLEPISSENVSETYQFIQKLKSSPKNFKHDLLRHRICLALTCPNALNTENRREEIKKCYDEKYKMMGLKGEITELTCWDKNTDRYPINVYDNAILYFFVGYLIFVFLCTLYEGTYRYESKEEYNRFISTTFGRLVGAFSITKNWIRLTTVELDPEIERLRCIQGVRFYSMILVILCHVGMVYHAVPTSNPQANENVYDNVLAQVFSNGSFLCATLFVLTTFLFSYNIYDVIEKKALTLKQFFLIFINRYIRLTPAFAAVIAFEATWMTRLNDGPLWDDGVGVESRNCRKNWLSMLFYVHNMVDRYNMCMQHTWYLALDMQYCILTLILMYLVQKFKRPILIPILSLIPFMIINFSLNYVNDYDAAPVVSPDLMQFFEYFKYPYWHRMTVSFFSHGTNIGMGLLYGYLYHKYRHVKLFTTKSKATIFWIVTYGCSAGIVLIPDYVIFQSGLPKNIFWASLYVATSKVIFIFGVMFGLHGVMEGVGWATKWALEFTPTYVLGRLTYSTYLVHVFVMKMQFAAVRHPVYVNDFDVFMDTLSNTCFCFIIGLGLTMLFELPISEIQKLYLPQKKNIVEANNLAQVNGVKKDKKIR